MIGLGIDTGGTCTDAVIYNLTTKEILGSGKALTTKEQLEIGIHHAIASLPEELLPQIKLAALSTTLATNACVEQKGGRAKLIFIGVNPTTVEETHMNYGLPSANEIFFLDGSPARETHTEQPPNWDQFRRDLHNPFFQCEAIAVVQLNSKLNHAAYEIKAKEIITEELHLPVIGGYELFQDLNVLRRGASTLLNARLIPLIQTFLDAVKVVFHKYNLTVPIVIVRSDGSLMSEQFTCERPVETLLCGPASSVLGGMELCGETNSLIVDMGGTTTDIAIVKDGIPLTVSDGIQIGNYKTFVKGLKIDTFGLGGDSGIRFEAGKLILAEKRLIPLCILADQYPYILQELRDLVDRVPCHSHCLHEFYVLIKDIDDKSGYTSFEQDFCNCLKQGPLSLQEAANKVQKDIYTLDVERLESEGVIMRSGLTTTDIMHLKGDFTSYNMEAARLGALFTARCTQQNLCIYENEANKDYDNPNVLLERLCNTVYDRVKKKLYMNICRILIQNENKYFAKNGFGEDMNNYLEQCYDAARDNLLNGSSPFMYGRIETKAVLVGVGAPIHIFLPDVASMLGTKSYIPKHASVANALGAIVGNVSAKKEVFIQTNYGGDALQSYTVEGNDQMKDFEELNLAVAYAVEEGKISVGDEILRRGGKGDVTFHVKCIEHNPKAGESFIHLGTTVVVHGFSSVGGTLD